VDVKDIKDLILAIDTTSIEKVEIEKSDIKIMITKKVINEGSKIEKLTIENLKGTNMELEAMDVDTRESKVESDNAKNNKIVINDENTHIVKCPIVGTFYEGASPDTPPFVKVGDMVEKGQTICIVEAMKIMNEIECEVAGQVLEILVHDEDIVEYGQPLMKIRR